MTVSRRIAWVAAGLALVVVAAVWFVVGSRTGQDWLFARVATGVFSNPAPTSFDGLRVFVCGSASPLIAPGHAQACIAVTAGEDLYIVDAGMGSVGPMQFAGEPLQHLRAILVTHFHSDHITGIPDFNLNSWVAGRRAPLRIVGPTGVERLVAGYNEAFALDAGYRVAHHGAEMLPPHLGAMVAEPVQEGVILAQGELTIRAFAVDHSPVQPAFGYRFDYGGRSVVVSGDTVVTEGLREAAMNADLLMQDALSLPMVQALETAAKAAGASRPAKIMADIPSYHAHAADLPALAESANVSVVALYHLIPMPRNYLMRQIFKRDLPSNIVLTTDGMVFELPRGTETVHIREP